MLTMPYGMFTYVVQYQKIVLPTALWVTRNVGYERLVLSACNPLYSAAQRIIIFAKLQSVTPLGPARQPEVAWGACGGIHGAVPPRELAWRLRSAHGPEPNSPRPCPAVASESGRSLRIAIRVQTRCSRPCSRPIHWSTVRNMDPAMLKERIASGDYEVDPVAVADAIMRRMRGLPEAAPQKECSYPESSSSPSVNTTPGVPSTTKPTHVSSPSRLRGPRGFSSFSALRAGTQTHSS